MPSKLERLTRGLDPVHGSLGFLRAAQHCVCQGASLAMHGAVSKRSGVCLHITTARSRTCALLGSCPHIGYTEQRLWSLRKVRKAVMAHRACDVW